MRKINRQDVVRVFFVLVLVAGIALASNSVGRFSPSHKIVQPVYCAACHPEQFEEIAETTHLESFAGNVMRAKSAYGIGEDKLSNRTAISIGCTMCHNTWDNREEMGLGDFYVKKDPDTGLILAKNAEIIPWAYGITDANKTYTPSESSRKGNITITLTNETDSVAGDINAAVKVTVENWHGLTGDTSGTFDALGVGNITFNTSSVAPVGVTVTDSMTFPIYGDYFNVEITNNGLNNLKVDVASIFGKADFKSTAKDLFTVTVAAGKKVNTDDKNIKAGMSTGLPYSLHTTFVYNYTRYDKVWGTLSANSPNPGIYMSTYGRPYFRPDVAGADTNYTYNSAEKFQRAVSCGSTERGGCHAGVLTAVGAAGALGKLPDAPGKAFLAGGGGSGIYFKHEMAYTTDTYADKSVKLCVVCHVNKAPPMDDAGKPLGVEKTLDYEGEYYNITAEWNAPTSWAHQQVACIRCHSHAGISKVVE